MSVNELPTGLKYTVALLAVMALLIGNMIVTISIGPNMKIWPNTPLVIYVTVIYVTMWLRVRCRSRHRLHCRCVSGSHDIYFGIPSDRMSFPAFANTSKL